jgi:hypothetical protein
MLENAEVVNENTFDVPLLMLHDNETVSVWNVIRVNFDMLRKVLLKWNFMAKWVKCAVIIMMYIVYYSDVYCTNCAVFSLPWGTVLQTKLLK